MQFGAVCPTSNSRSDSDFPDMPTITRVLLVLGLGAAAGCSGVSGTEQGLAQCQLDVLGSKGETFRMNYAEGEFTPSGKDGSYREFMLTCMQAKGYDFAPPFDENGENKACWIEDKEGILPDAFVDEPSCYGSKWW